MRGVVLAARGGARHSEAFGKGSRSAREHNLFFAYRSINDEVFRGLPDNPGTGLFSPLQRKSRAEKESDREWRDNIFYSHKQGQVKVVKDCDV